jgi:hypothetical protein
LCFQASRLLQLHIQKLIETSWPFQIFEMQPGFRQLFVVLLGNTDWATLRDAEFITTGIT